MEPGQSDRIDVQVLALLLIAKANHLLVPKQRKVAGKDCDLLIL
jgi:hypothetical protein